MYIYRERERERNVLRNWLVHIWERASAKSAGLADDRPQTQEGAMLRVGGA